MKKLTVVAKLLNGGKIKTKEVLIKFTKVNMEKMWLKAFKNEEGFKRIKVTKRMWEII